MLKALIDKLEKEHILSPAEFAALIEESTRSDRDYLFEKARKIKESYFGNKIYIRGLIEFTNYCKTTAFTAESGAATRTPSVTGCLRTRYSPAAKPDILWAFVPLCFRAARDPYFNDERMTDIVSSIKERYGDCALTLSLGREAMKATRLCLRPGGQIPASSRDRRQ